MTGALPPDSARTKGRLSLTTACRAERVQGTLGQENAFLGAKPPAERSLIAQLSHVQRMHWRPVDSPCTNLDLAVGPSKNTCFLTCFLAPSIAASIGSWR